MEGKTKTTDAERCKRYREKNADEYKINDASRKKRARLLLKADKSKHEVYKKKEIERKQLAKIRKDIARETNRTITNTKSLWVHLHPSATRPSNQGLSKKRKSLFHKVQEVKKK